MMPQLINKYPSVLTMRRSILILALLCTFVAHAQSPVVYSVDRKHAAMRDIVTLHGSDFGTDRAQVDVFFGAAKGEIKSISNQVIEVRVPAGATLDAIRVLHRSSGLSGQAPGQFFLNYRGETGITAAKFSAQADFQAQSGLYDLCLCDFNDDGKTDVATASNNSNLITLFRNTSTPGNISFVPQDFLVSAKTLHVKCGDLNGDGRQDIALTEGSDGNRLFILTNNGNFSFSQQIIQLPGIKIKQLALADLDVDGRLDITVTNTGGNILTLLPNTSRGQAVSFGTPIVISVPQASSTDALAVSDLDGNGFPELVTSQYQTDNENKLFIAVNNGSFAFAEIKVVAVNRAISNIRIADLDADTRPDIVVARLTGSDVSVYLNQSGTGITLAPPLSVTTESLPVGLDVNDFDGDARPDLAVGSIAKSVSVINNLTASAGAGAFSPVIKLATTYINRNLRSGDIDGDGKPDIVFTSVDDFSGVPAPASKISVMRNLSCMNPGLSPGGAHNICTGNTLRLTATAGGGTTYEWYRDANATPIKTGIDPFLDVTTSGEYRVKAVSTSPSCAKESEPVTITVSAPAATLNQNLADARSNSPVCTDNTLTLQVNDVGATEYRWRGPANFSQNVTSPSLSRQNFTLGAAGLYIVDMMSGGCVARTDSTLVEAVTIPEFAVTYSGSGKFCYGGTKNLSLAPALTSGFSYQWYEKADGPIAQATTTEFNALASGEYYAVVTSDHPGCQPRQTAAVTLAVVQPPDAGFNSPASGCAGTEILFSQQSTGDPGATILYLWTFGDGSTSADANPRKTFSTAKSFEVSLKVSYDGVESCSAVSSKMISIVNPLKPQITASATSLCEGESVNLSVAGNFASVKWANNQTGNTTSVSTPGSHSVTTVDASGCSGQAEITLYEKTTPVVTVSAERESIAAGQAVGLSASGADDYVWSPGKSLNDSTIADPRASPLSTTTYTVKGSLAGGCSATATISILVSGEVLGIAVPVLFSPNGDNANETLIIEGVENYPDCSLNVFDKRGGRVFASTGYMNNWDGTINGSPLPEGVYYYVFGCPNKKTVTGTVTIIR